jgi:drug/metabolite transporter (DMT)-like permease
MLIALPVFAAALAELALAWRLRAATSGVAALGAAGLAVAVGAGADEAKPLLAPALVLLVLGAGLLWIGQLVQRALDDEEAE